MQPPRDPPAPPDAPGQLQGVSQPRVQRSAFGARCQGGQRLFRGGRIGEQFLRAHGPGQETPAGAGGATSHPVVPRQRPIPSQKPLQPGPPAGCSGAAELALRQPCPLPTWAGDSDRGDTERQHGEGRGRRRGAELLTPALPALQQNFLSWPEQRRVRHRTLGGARENPGHGREQSWAGTEHPARAALNPRHGWHQTRRESAKPTARPAPEQHSWHRSGSRGLTMPG